MLRGRLVKMDRGRTTLCDRVVAVLLEPTGATEVGLSNMGME